MREFNDIECCLSKPIVLRSRVSLFLLHLFSFAFIVWIFNALAFLFEFRMGNNVGACNFVLRSTWKWNQSKLLLPFFSRYCILLSYLEIHDEIDGFIHLVIWNCIRHIDRKIQFRQLFTSLSSMLFASNQNSSNQLSDGLFFTFQCMDCVECKKKTFAWNRQIEMVWEMKGTSIWDLNRGIWLLIFEHLSKLLKCGN